MKNAFKILMLLIFLSKISISQEIVSNKDIISMKTAKIADDIILTKIDASKCNFDLTTKGLIDLKSSKISEKIIKQMMATSPPVETINNDDIIKMCLAGIDSKLIIQKIDIVPHNFDTSSNGLISLTNSKVPKDLIKKIIQNPNSEGQNIVTSNSAVSKPISDSSNNSPSEKSTPVEVKSIYTFNILEIKNCPEPEFSSRPYYLTTEKMLKNFERADAKIDVKIKGLGYGGSEVSYSVFTPKSTTRFKKDNISPFVIKVDGDSDPSELVFLVRTSEILTDRRRFIMSKMSMGGKSADLAKFNIPLEFKKIKSGVYQIFVPDNLQSGEYGFMPMNTNNEASTIKITCFGID